MIYTGPAQLDRMVADGQLAEDDRTAVLEFAAFLRDTAEHPGPLTPNLLRKHRAQLGLTHTEIDDREDHLAATDRASWPGQ